MISANPSDPDPEPSNPAAKSEPRARGIALGIALGLALTIAALAALLLWNRNPTPPLTEEALHAAEQRWERNGPRDYDLDIELAGNRAGQVHVEVRHGEVTHMSRDGVVPSQRRTWDYWSVPGMLETIRQELEMARDPAASFKSAGITQMAMWAEFDRRLGYPARYDRVVLGGDFEVHWRVTRFVDRTPEK